MIVSGVRIDRSARLVLQGDLHLLRTGRGTWSPGNIEPSLAITTDTWSRYFSCTGRRRNELPLA